MAYLWQSEINSRINEWLIPQTWVMSPEDSTNMKEYGSDTDDGDIMLILGTVCGQKEGRRTPLLWH